MGIPHQFKQPNIGGTDAGAMQRVRAGVPSITVAVPARYIHSPAAIMDLNDFENTLALPREALPRLPERAAGHKEGRRERAHQEATECFGPSGYEDGRARAHHGASCPKAWRRAWMPWAVSSSHRTGKGLGRPQGDAGGAHGRDRRRGDARGPEGIPAIRQVSAACGRFP